LSSMCGRRRPRGGQGHKREGKDMPKRRHGGCFGRSGQEVERGRAIPRSSEAARETLFGLRTPVGTARG
jgi:hypothetical protein